MVSPLAGKAVLITGAARGIGEQVARLAAARGARIVALGTKNGARIDEMEAEVRAFGRFFGKHSVGEG